MAIYTQPGEPTSSLAVGPLDDGSICLWDVSGEKGRKGKILARSRSGILSVDPNAQNEAGRRSKMISTGVTGYVPL